MNNAWIIPRYVLTEYCLQISYRGLLQQMPTENKNKLYWLLTHHR